MSEINLSRLNITMNFLKIASLWTCSLMVCSTVTVSSYRFVQSVNSNTHNIEIVSKKLDSLYIKVLSNEKKISDFSEWKRRTDPYISNFKKYAHD